MSNDLTTRESGQHVAFFTPATLPDLLQFAETLASSQVVPKTYQGRPQDIVAALQMGAEDGLPPMAALRNIAVINGRPAYYGDSIPGLAMAKGYITDVVDSLEGEGDQRAAVVTVTKRNGHKLTRRFSVADAKKAGLFGKQGPWAQYTDRMLFMRARSWAIRDAAPHAQFGPAVEELQHIGPENAREINPGSGHDPQTGEVHDDPMDQIARPVVESEGQPTVEHTPATEPVQIWISEADQRETALESAAEALTKVFRSSKTPAQLQERLNRNIGVISELSQDEQDELDRLSKEVLAKLKQPEMAV